MVYIMFYKQTLKHIKIDKNSKIIYMKLDQSYLFLKKVCVLNILAYFRGLSKL